MADEFDKDWAENVKLFEKLQANHAKFAVMNVETHKLEAENMSSIGKLKKNLKTLKGDLAHHKAQFPASKVAEIDAAITKNTDLLALMEPTYPRPLSTLLRSLLGSVNVTLPVASDRLKYKAEYEEYKLTFTYYIIGMSIICALYSHRILDALFQIVLVSFYCITTLREHILIANGSKILPWWLIHHYFAILLSTIMVIWPSGDNYVKFRFQFMMFSIYLGVVQVIQHQYQAAVLYKKRALGESEAMAITSDVPTPALFYWVLLASLLVYAFQLYNAYCLGTIIMTGNPVEWHVPAIASIFLIHAVGNFVSLIQVTLRKLRKPSARPKTK